MATQISLDPSSVPQDVYNGMFVHLPPYDLLVASLVCKLWKTFASDNVLWIPNANSLRIAYKENDSVMKRVVASCKRYCHASEKMVDYRHSNIIVKALGRMVLAHAKVDAFLEKLKLTLPKHHEYLVDDSANELRMNPIMAQFKPWFAQVMQTWLLQNSKKQYLVAIQDSEKQKELKNDLFNLCKQFKDSEPTYEEITDIFHIFRSRGIQIKLLCFTEFKKNICQNGVALEQCAELVIESDEAACHESNEWIRVLENYTQELVVNVFEQWKCKNQLVFPAYWCVLLKKIEKETLDRFLIKILGIVDKNISLNPSQLQNAKDILNYYISCVWSPSEVELRKPLIAAAYFNNDILFGKFAAILESQEGIYSDFAIPESDQEDAL